MDYDICVVIVNYNGGALLRRAVQAARRSEAVRVAIVVVDNASSDTSFVELEADHDLRSASDTLFLQSRSNAGFARGNNLALQAFPSRYICLLNPDAEVDPHSLSSLSRFLDAYNDVGICGPQLVSADGSPQAFSHGSDPTPRYLLQRAIARRARSSLHRWDGAAPRAVDWVAGTCMMIRPKVLQQCGSLDERIFMYFEDNDLCLRARNAGWLIYFTPSATVTHWKEPARADAARQAAYARGLELFYRRHYGILGGASMRTATNLRRVVGAISQE